MRSFDKFIEKRFEESVLKNKNHQMDKDLKVKIWNFLKDNYKEIQFKINSDKLVEDLPSHLKDEFLFMNYGKLMYKFNFFKKLNDNDIVSSLLRVMTKMHFS